ncbi:MAG: sensor histidine kinase [Cellulosilyticaceae bacterium]
MKQHKNFSLKRKFCVLSLCFLSISLILTLSITYKIKELLFQKQIAYATSNAERFRCDITYMYKKVYTLYDFLLFDRNIEELFLDPFTSQTTSQLNNINNILLSLGIMNEDIADITLVGHNFSYSGLFDVTYVKQLIEPVQSSRYISSLGIMPSSFLDASDKLYLVFHKKLYGYHNQSSFGQGLGDILISVDPSLLIGALPQDTLEDTTCFMVIDQFQNIYPFNASLDAAQQLVDTSIPNEIFVESKSIPGMLASETDDYLIYTSFVPEMKYYIMSVLDKSKLLSQLTPILYLCFLIVAITTLFICISLYLILSNILNPINKISGFIKEIRDGNMKNLKHSLPLEGSSEVITLSSTFNGMMSEITSLNKQLFSTTTRLYELELQKNKAEILHLRSQINPHFLYNTLESIRGLAMENNSPEIAQIALCMGKIFNYSIRGKNKTALEEEIAITKSYLDIQRIRFNQKFEVIYNILPPTSQVIVPKMILQPLIENAIFHGLEPKLTKGVLYIASSMADHTLYITIQDDGVGIPPSKLQALVDSLASSNLLTPTPSMHIGVLNVHNRIRLEYGDGYGLTFESTVNIGTKTTLTLPILNSGGPYA